MTEDLGDINEIRDALAYLRDDFEQWKKIVNQLPDSELAQRKLRETTEIRDLLIKKLEHRENTWKTITNTSDNITIFD